MIGLAEPPLIDISEYREIRLLERTENASVYLCTRVTTRRTVALYPHGLFGRSVRLAQIMRSMTHPAPFVCLGFTPPSRNCQGGAIPAVPM
jgi:hypothetical protein